MKNPRKIAIVENEFEAQLLDDILADRNIPHLIKTFHDTALDGLYQSQKGWGAVFADSQYEQEILGVLVELREFDDEETIPE